MVAPRRAVLGCLDARRCLPSSRVTTYEQIMSVVGEMFARGEPFSAKEAARAAGESLDVVTTALDAAVERDELESARGSFAFSTRPYGDPVGTPVILVLYRRPNE